MANKVIGLDLGTTTLGIAQSDFLGFVHGVETFHFDKNQYIVARKHVHELVAKTGIKELVIGLPLHLNGEMSEMAQNCLRFKDALLKEDPTLKIEMFDERLSTVSAHNSLSARGVNHETRKASVDRIAACVILDTYIRRKEFNNGN